MQLQNRRNQNTPQPLNQSGNAPTLGENPCQCQKSVKKQFQQQKETLEEQEDQSQRHSEEDWTIWRSSSSTTWTSSQWRWHSCCSPHQSLSVFETPPAAPFLTLDHPKRGVPTCSHTPSFFFDDREEEQFLQSRPVAG